jgi:hypothetical protein
MTNVGFDILGRQLRNGHKTVWNETKEITPLRAQEAKVFPFLPVTFVWLKSDRKQGKMKENGLFLLLWKDICFVALFVELVGLGNALGSHQTVCWYNYKNSHEGHGVRREQRTCIDGTGVRNTWLNEN